MSTIESIHWRKCQPQCSETEFSIQLIYSILTHLTFIYNFENTVYEISYGFTDVS